MSQRLVSPPEVPTAGIQEGMEGPEIQLGEDRKASRRKPHLLHGRVEERGREPVGALASPPGRGRPLEKGLVHSKNSRVPAASRQGAASTFTRPLAGGCPGASAPSLAAHLGVPSPQGPSFHTGLLPETAPSLGPSQGDFRRCTRCSYPHRTGAGWGPRGMVGPREKREQGCGAAWTWRCALCPERPIMSPLHPHYPHHGPDTAGLGRDLAGQNHSGDTSPRVLISPGNL